jgi:uncharacterized membrane protein
MRSKFIKVIFTVVSIVFLLSLSTSPVLAAELSQTASATLSKALKPAYIKITTDYPRTEADYYGSATFEVILSYNDSSNEAATQLFDLSVTVPEDWTSSITPQYPISKTISSIQLKPDGSNSVIEVTITPPTSPLPAPGSYDCTLQASSGNVKGTITLTSVLQSIYMLYLQSDSTAYTASAGSDNYLPLDVINYGTAALSNITLSADKPEGWEVTFTTQNIDAIAVGYQTNNLEVNVKPAANTPTGDYLITLRASAQEADSQSLPIRIQVTAFNWSFVISIVLAVLAAGGLIFGYIIYIRR